MTHCERGLPLKCKPLGRLAPRGQLDRTRPTRLSDDQRKSSRLLRCLRKERCQDLLYVLALTLGAVGTPVAMLRKWLDAIKHMMAVATTIFVGRHAALHIRPSEGRASC